MLTMLRIASRLWRYVGVFVFYIGLVLLTASDIDLCESVRSEYSNNTGSAYRFHSFDSVPMRSRRSRLFSFEADDKDIKVDLEFVVPFIRIPVKRSMDATGHALKNLVNLNTASLVISGVLFLIGTSVGAIYKSLTTTVSATHYPYAFKRNSRITNDVFSLMNPSKLTSQRNSPDDGSSTNVVRTEFEDLIYTIEKKLRANDIDMAACIQKSICEFVKKAAKDVRTGHGTGTNKIIDGLTSWNVVQDLLAGTAVQDAVYSAKSTLTCGNVYQSCKSSNLQSKLMDLAFNYFR